MAGHNLTPDQEDYFDLLCRLIEDYEREHAQLDAPKVTALDALQHLLDATHMSAADLARLLDVHRTLGAMILRGERRLTLAHVRKLARRFSVSADLFLPCSGFASFYEGNDAGEMGKRDAFEPPRFTDCVTPTSN